MGKEVKEARKERLGRRAKGWWKKERRMKNKAKGRSKRRTQRWTTSMTLKMTII